MAFEFDLCFGYNSMETLFIINAKKVDEEAIQGMDIFSDHK